MVMMADATASGLSIYQNVWRKYFPKTVNLGIGRDKLHNVLWRAANVDLTNGIQTVKLQRGTNNIDHDKAILIANGK